MTDFRSKPDSEWTYYVVDHLPTMNKLYRFDTVEEAIAKFKEFPVTAISAIGSSKYSSIEIDHIHRRNGRAVLVTDSERVESSIWRDSEEIQAAIDKMISALNVHYELSSDIFGSKYPFVAIPIERHQTKVMDRYFEDKILSSSQGIHPLQAVNEIFVAGEGWVSRKDFFDLLDDCAPQMDGNGAKTLFVEKLNIRYVNHSNRIGQADVFSPD